MYVDGLFTDHADTSLVATSLWEGVDEENIRKTLIEKKLQTAKPVVENVIKPIDQGIDRNKQSGVDTKKTVQQQHVKTHQNLSNNGVKDFFKNKRILSFDTETTGLDYKNENLSKRDRIWQVGLAIDGASGVEEHTSPFFRVDNNGELKHTTKMAKPYLISALKNSNGRFSREAFEKGNFNTFISAYQNNNLKSLTESLSKTIGNINLSDVVVLQNMNFENNMLKSSLDQNIISRDFYETLASKMHTTSLDKEGNTLHLFQRPLEVQRKMRQADMLYHTEYLNNISEKTFQEYRQNVNSAIKAYSDVINDKNRVGAVAVELQDLTKAFLANAANRGYIEKQTSTLGLNVDFLSRAILGYSESHTALKDSEDTISLFKTMWQMNSELESGVELNKNTLAVLSNIKEQQPNEVNRKFLSTVKSVLNDFRENNSTEIGDRYNWYNPEVKLKTKKDQGFSLDDLNKISTTNKQKENSFPKAMENVLNRYSNFIDNIEGFNREAFVKNVIEQRKVGLDFNKIHSYVEDFSFNYKPDLSVGNTNESIISKRVENNIKNTTSDTTTLLGKEMKPKTKATILGGLGVGLAYMAFSTTPKPLPDTSGNVSEQFYDEQYLGTAFVDFKERNKHYMM